jgi:hypothetical protein
LGIGLDIGEELMVATAAHWHVLVEIIENMLHRRQKVAGAEGIGVAAVILRADSGAQIRECLHQRYIPSADESKLVCCRATSETTADDQCRFQRGDPFIAAACKFCVELGSAEMRHSLHSVRVDTAASLITERRQDFGGLVK